MARHRVLFAGTPEFALASLTALVEAGIKPVGVYTRPDRPAGRGKQLTASPVKHYAKTQHIPVYQPHTLRDAKTVDDFADLEPDVFIVAAYGLILPKPILDIPTFGCINVHASLLPRWRGAAPIQAAILAGDETTGISLMEMTEGLDNGPVYTSKSIRIGADENAGQLHGRLAKLGGEMIVRHLGAILDRELRPAEQDDSQATYANKIQTMDAVLDWQRPAAELGRRVRAYNPVPGSFFLAGDERIKCWSAKVVDRRGPVAGSVLSCDRDGVVVACGEQALSMQVLQRPGKREVSAAQFADQLDLSGEVLGTPL
ncbi:MAG: methionyl-tRNA formyltransferase [Woeseiaceae bacterium]|nr:methionyl-tRNA formyltransferase [Woeseiaceae bacterium]